MNIDKAVRNLELRGYAVKRFATGAEAADYMTAQIRGCTVGIGGSKTVEQLGLFDRLSEANSVYWHWKVPMISGWSRNRWAKQILLLVLAEWHDH